MPDQAALVVIDVQRGLIEGFEDDWEHVLPVIADQIERARSASAPVVLVQHCGSGPAHPLAPDAAGWELHPAIDARPADSRVRKTWSDAFVATDLQAQLKQARVSRLVVTGAQTEFCVDATVRRAASLGYDVDLIADGHTTSANGVLSRAQIVAHHNETLPGLACAGPTIRAVLSRDVAWPPTAP
jgi:nicotinamidase-related amidase